MSIAVVESNKEKFNPHHAKVKPSKKPNIKRKIISNDDPLADMQRNADEVNASKQKTLSPEQQEQKSYLKLLESIDDKFTTLSINMNLEGNDSLDANNESFNGKMHDALFNFGRRFPNVKMNNINIAKWPEVYGTNFVPLIRKLKKQRNSQRN